jgi:hypothetical protein
MNLLILKTNWDVLPILDHQRNKILQISTQIEFIKDDPIVNSFYKYLFIIFIFIK